MAVNNGVITSISDFSEVGNVLQTSCLTTDNLCTHRNINIWSRYKPFSYAQKFFKQDTDSTKTDRDLALAACNYGLTISELKHNGGRQNLYDISQNLAWLDENINGGLNGWTYSTPTGGSTSPYRISDFLNYAHKAKFAVQNVRLKHDIMVQPYSENKVVLIADTPLTPISGEKTLNLGLTDFPVLNDCLLGVFIQRSDGKKWVITAESLTALSSGWEPAKELGGSVGMVYKITPFLFKPTTYVKSSGYNTLLTDLVNNYGYTIPYTNTITAEVIASKIVASFAFTKVMSGTNNKGGCTVTTITLTNYYNESKTFTNNSLYNESKTQTKALDTITIPANSSVTLSINYTFANIPMSDKIVIALNNADWQLTGAPRYPAVNESLT